MRTSPRHLDTTAAGAGRYTVAPHLRATPRLSARATNDYGLPRTSRPQCDASSVVELWLVGPHFVERDADRTSDLRKQVLSYRAERPRDSSVAKAVNDALRFIDLIPITAILPYVALADDGEVNFYWRCRESLLIDVGFVGDGMIHYYVWDEVGGVDLDASISFSGRSLPPDIMKTVPRLSGPFRTDAHG